MATAAASEATTWRAGAASVLSEAVGAADVVGAGVEVGEPANAELNGQKDKLVDRNTD